MVQRLPETRYSITSKERRSASFPKKRLDPGSWRRSATSCDELRPAGERPYAIPTGGSVPIGAVAMVAELLAQLVTAGEDPSRLYFPTGSLGTQAGLVVGVRAFSAPFAVYGVAVEHPVEQLIADGVTLANGTAELLETSQRFSVTVITIDGAFIGAAYGVPTDEGIEAIRLLAKTEAVFLDPVYSGKAMAALISHARVGQLDPNEAVVFLHTGGGPSLFATGTTLV